MPDLSTPMPKSGNLATIPVPGAAPMQGALVDGKPYAAIRPICEALGVDADAQLKRLKRRSWGTTVMMTVVAADGKAREMVMIDRRTLTMWLATIDENRVKEEARPTIRAYQAEAADALDAYFHDGGAINPSATADQLDTVIAKATAQAGLLAALKGLIDPKHLEAKARLVMARGLGEAPELDPMDTPLYAQTYLEGKGLSRGEIKSLASNFGKRVKLSYELEHGREPRKYPLETGNGQVRMVNAYTEADRELMDGVWEIYFEGRAS